MREDSEFLFEVEVNVGMHQGCVLSSFSFAFVAELLYLNWPERMC